MQTLSGDGGLATATATGGFAPYISLCSSTLHVRSQTLPASSIPYMYYENIPFPTFAQEAGSRPKWRPKHRRPLGKPGDPSLLSAQHVRGPSSPGKRLFPARGRRGSRPSTQRLVPAQAPSACKYSNAAPFLFSTTCVLAIANSENMQSDSVETNSVYREAQARWRARTLVIHVL